MKKSVLFIAITISLSACGGAPTVTVSTQDALPPPLEQGVACSEEWVHMPMRINFPSGGTDLDAQNREILQELARTAMTRPDIHAVRVEGHTDTCGNEINNMALSEARARSVAADVATMGVPSERITTVGYGSTQPRTTEACDRRGPGLNELENRRVEFTLLICR